MMKYSELMDWVQSELNKLNIVNKYKEHYEGSMALMAFSEIMGRDWIQLNEDYFIAKKISEEEFRSRVTIFLAEFQQDRFRSRLEKKISDLKNHLTQSET